MKTKHHSHPYRKMFDRRGFLKRRPLGIIVIKRNDIDEKLKDDFKKEWEGLLSSNINSRRIPIIFTGKNEEVKFQQIPSPKRARFLLYVKNNI